MLLESIRDTSWNRIEKFLSRNQWLCNIKNEFWRRFLFTDETKRAKRRNANFRWQNMKSAFKIARLFYLSFSSRACSDFKKCFHQLVLVKQLDLPRQEEAAKISDPVLRRIWFHPNFSRFQDNIEGLFHVKVIKIIFEYTYSLETFQQTCIF